MENINQNIYSIIDIKNKLEPVFTANGVKRAVLFGSYALGNANKDSDVDILVDSGLRGLDFVGLIENAREALQKQVDLIDINYIRPGSQIERDVTASGILIYG